MDDMFVKVISVSHIYYIHVNHMDIWLRRRAWQVARGITSKLDVMLNFEFVLSKRDNIIVKNRSSIEDVINGKFAKPFMTITLED